MAKPLYRLTQAHFLRGGVYADVGSTIGSTEEGADYEWDPELDGAPTSAMLPLNEEGRQATLDAQKAFDPMTDEGPSVDPFDAGKDDQILSDLKADEQKAQDGNAQIARQADAAKAKLLGEAEAKEQLKKAPAAKESGTGKPVPSAQPPKGSDPNEVLSPKG